MLHQQLAVVMVVREPLVELVVLAVEQVMRQHLVQQEQQVKVMLVVVMMHLVAVELVVVAQVLLD